MEDDDEKDDTKRKSRNLSEKKRRDQFNLLVNELNSMVSTNTRKMDKSTVLKSTIAFLKNHNEVAVRSRVHEIQENWKPSFLPNEEFTHLILEALDGFIIVFSVSGKVHYTSESITSLLGHLPNDLLNTTIYEMVYEEEQQSIYNILLNPPKTVMDPLLTGISPENQVSFLCRLKRGSMENPPKVSYEYVRFTGYFREFNRGLRNSYWSCVIPGDNVDIENMTPSSRYSSYSGEADTRTLFVGTGRLMTPQLIREMSIVDTKSEFTSRHSLEWKFLFLDHRAPPIIGYLPFEVLGTSGYDYYHFDDLDRVVTCHEALMQKGEGTSCFYRFLTKGQQWIWLQTRFYITYHQWNSKPEFVVCTHRVVSYADVMKHMRNNNGSLIKSDEDTDSPVDDKRTAVSTSNLMVTSPWSSRSSRASRSQTQTTQESNSVKHKRTYSYRIDTDSASMSGDSPLSHHSMMTQSTAASKRSRTKHNVPLPQAPGQPPPHSHFSQFSLPHAQNSNPLLQPINHPPHSIKFQAPLTSQLIPNHQRPPTQVIGSPFLDQSPQFLTAIPVQQVFSTAGTVISPIQPSSDFNPSNVVISPAQNQIQDHLQRKHEELQMLIVQQQDELRRVSEQLFMARYGIIPSVVNVSLPYIAPIDQSDGGEGSRGITTHATFIEQQPQQMMTHTQVSNQQPQVNPQIVVHQPQSQSQIATHQQHPPHHSNSYDLKHTSSDQTMEDAQQNDDIMQYMQHQAQTVSSQPMHQQLINNDDFELMPFQMLNQQAQMLFSSGNNNLDCANNPSSNK